MRPARLRIPAALALLGLAAICLPASGQAPPGPPPPAPWEPPERFVGVWLRGGAFFPAPTTLSDPHTQSTVGMGIGLRPVSFATLEVEGGWIGRDFAAPGGSGRATLSSRVVTLGVRLHHPVLGLEPSAFGGLSFLRSTLEVPSSAGVDVENAGSTGLAVGAGVDLPLGSSLAVGVDWRYLWGNASLERLGGGTVAVGGHTLGGAVRLYWP